MKVVNLTNARGNKVANQFKIITDNKVYFQSYDSIVAALDKRNGNLVLSAYWDYSKTTIRHLYSFLADYGLINLCSAPAMRKAIELGEVEVMPETSLSLD